jgi:fused signal recognition particle receptor
MSWLDRLRGGFQKTAERVADNLTGITSRAALDTATLDDIEEALIASDLGPEASHRIREAIAAQKFEQLDERGLRSILADEIEKILTPVAKPLEVWGFPRPHVILVIGVNGSGKTTTIGKLAHWLKEQDYGVLLAAGDTFRAAAIEQLEVWAQRTGADLIKQQTGADPSAVAFDAVQAAKARKVDYVIIDTAGRLHTKTNLMAELEKMRRTVSRVIPDAPHEVLLVIEATTGQNGLEQARKFTETSAVTGIILTKLDGTAKGGVVVAISRELNLPIRYVGVGEQLDDLLPFDPTLFVASLFD